MPAGELIFANVLDVRQRAAEGDLADGLVYLLAVPGRAPPLRGDPRLEVPHRLRARVDRPIAPLGQGHSPHRAGGESYLYGSMDLTHFEAVVEDALFEELGVFLASFLLDGEVLGQTEFQVVLQARPPSTRPTSRTDSRSRT